MTQPTPIPEARGELMFDGQALLDALLAAKLAGMVDRPAVDLNVRYRFRDNEQAASVAFDVAAAFFSPLLSALYGDIATLHAQRDSLLAAAKAVVDAGRCAGLGSVGAALVAAVEAVTHPGGET